MTTQPEAHRFQKIKAETHRRMVECIDLSKLPTWKPERLKHEVRSLAARLAQSGPEPMNEEDRNRLVDEVVAESFGLGPLEPLMGDPTISDILVNGPNEVFIEREGRLERTDIVFADSAHLMQIIQRIAARIGRRADETSPMVDARLPDGSRVNAIIPPLALEGPILSIRRFGIRLQVDDLLANATMPSQVADLLRAAVAGRVSMVISGGTGAGKTTLLNALSRFIPEDERLVTIEDSAELHLEQPHVARLETRPANLEGVGEVRQRELVRNALRMRPDRIIVGEVRGAEALDMIQAMTTGHEGSLTTIHANNTRDALERLEMMIMMAGFDMPVTVIRQYIASAVGLIVHVSRLKGGVRKVMRVTEIRGRKGDRYVVRDLFGFRQTETRDGVAVGDFYGTGKLPGFLGRLRTAGLEVPDSMFAEGVLHPAGMIAHDATPVEFMSEELMAEEVTPVDLSTDKVDPRRVQDDDNQTPTTYID